MPSITLRNALRRLRPKRGAISWPHEFGKPSRAERARREHLAARPVEEGYQRIIGNASLANSFVQGCRFPKGKKYQIFVRDNEGHVGIARLWGGRRIGKTIGFCSLKFGIDGSKRVIYIETVQGIFGSKRDLDLFSKESGQKWNTHLVQTVIDNAYYLGFDRVKFIKVEHQKDFRLNQKMQKQAMKKRRGLQRAVRERKEPYAKLDELERIVRENAKTLTAMRDLYTGIARDMGFRKEEGAYWVVDFP